MRGYEVLREMYRVVERRNGAVYRTEYVKDIWVRLRPDGGMPSAPENHQFVSKPTSFDGMTIRSVPKGG